MTGENLTDPLTQGLEAHLSEPQRECLRTARVGIAGAGGLGSNVAMLLARSGIGALVVADKDRVEASNLNRQWYFPEDLGLPKVRALGRRLARLAPNMRYKGICAWLTPDTARGHFASCPVVVEALDDAAQKAALCSSLLSAGFFVVAASGIGGYGRPPLAVRRVGKGLVCVGDGDSGTEQGLPMLGPRVMQAAALQADAVLAFFLHSQKG